MSETVKLIIEIPKEKYEHIKTFSDVVPDTYSSLVKSGIPLDDVKAEIEKEENIWYHDCEPENGWKRFDVIRVDTVCEILDNIGKENGK